MSGDAPPEDIEREKLTLEKQKFEHEKSKSVFANVAVIVTIIGGISAILFQIGNFYTARQQEKAAALNLQATTAQAQIQAQNNFDLQGLSLFVSAEDKLVNCNSDLTKSQIDLFSNLFPTQIQKFQNVAATEAQSCIASQSNAAAGQALAQNDTGAAVLTKADAARYAAVGTYAAAITPSNTSPSALPTVYIQINSESQRGQAITLQTALKAKGYKVPGIEKVNAAPDTAQLRYYYPDQYNQAANTGTAEQLAVLIEHTLNMGAPPDIKGPYAKTYKNLPAGIMEYWFPATTD